MSIGTDASRATLEALSDAKLLTPSTVSSFLSAAAAAAAAAGNDARSWKIAAQYSHLLVQYLRYSRQTEVLALLRRWASSEGLPQQRQQTLQQLMPLLDVDAFVRWVTQVNDRRHKPSPSTAADLRDATGALSAAAAARPRSPKPPAAKSPSGSGKASPAPADLKDPLDQLVEWEQRLRALGGRTNFLAKGQAPPANVTSNATKSPYLNVGSPKFQARRIGVVFHVFQFMDRKGFLYPPGAYSNGSAPAHKMLNIVNSLYRYSGTNIQFYLRQYRTNIKKYPYLLFNNGTSYQECAVAAEGCLCRAAASFNANPRRYINVYIVGSSTYQPLVSDPAVPFLASSAFTAAVPQIADGCAFLYDPRYPAGTDGPWDARRSVRQQYVWLNWDSLDPLASNTAKAYNQGASSLGHELGHLMGLAHTFQGGCGATNDGVADTPPEDGDGSMLNGLRLMPLCQQVTVKGRLPTRAQLKKYDSCAGDRYIDNIFNLMSYSPALCRLYLTRGQIRRMQSLTSKYYGFEVAA